MRALSREPVKPETFTLLRPPASRTHLSLYTLSRFFFVRSGLGCLLCDYWISPVTSLSQNASLINTLVMNASSSSAGEAVWGRRGKVRVKVTP